MIHKTLHLYRLRGLTRFTFGAALWTGSGSRRWRNRQYWEVCLTSPTHASRADLVKAKSGPRNSRLCFESWRLNPFSRFSTYMNEKRYSRSQQVFPRHLVFIVGTLTSVMTENCVVSVLSYVLESLILPFSIQLSFHAKWIQKFLNPMIHIVLCLPRII